MCSDARKNGEELYKSWHISQCMDADRSLLSFQNSEIIQLPQA